MQWIVRLVEQNFFCFFGLFDEAKKSVFSLSLFLSVSKVIDWQVQSWRRSKRDEITNKREKLQYNGQKDGERRFLWAFSSSSKLTKKAKQKKQVNEKIFNRLVLLCVRSLPPPSYLSEFCLELSAKKTAQKTSLQRKKQRKRKKKT